jgi:hypothetical protein
VVARLVLYIIFWLRPTILFSAEVGISAGGDVGEL